jgi:hypothetical protein
VAENIVHCVIHYMNGSYNAEVTLLYLVKNCRELTNRYELRGPNSACYLSDCLLAVTKGQIVKLVLCFGNRLCISFLASSVYLCSIVFNTPAVSCLHRKSCLLLNVVTLSVA